MRILSAISPMGVKIQVGGNDLYVDRYTPSSLIVDVRDKAGKNGDMLVATIPTSWVITYIEEDPK